MPFSERLVVKRTNSFKCHKSGWTVINTVMSNVCYDTVSYLITILQVCIIDSCGADQVHLLISCISPALPNTVLPAAEAEVTERKPRATPYFKGKCGGSIDEIVVYE